MELKLTHEILYQFLSVLLIVTYGIETIERTVLQDKHGLLIVPYGIETLLDQVGTVHGQDF